MSKIKKYIPVIVTLSLGLVVLISQVLLKSRSIKASPTETQNKLKLHYESNLKNVKYQKLGKTVNLSNSIGSLTKIKFLL